jgi:hypothetical protein
MHINHNALLSTLSDRCFNIISQVVRFLNTLPEIARWDFRLTELRNIFWFWFNEVAKWDLM